MRQRPDEVEIEVADRGPGVAADILPRIFQPFSLVDTVSGDSRRTGLGLAVARGFVEAHGGRIWAGNRVDGGACFAFTLPVEEVPTTNGVHD